MAPKLGARARRCVPRTLRRRSPLLFARSPRSRPRRRVGPSHGQATLLVLPPSFTPKAPTPDSVWANSQARQVSSVVLCLKQGSKRRQNCHDQSTRPISLNSERKRHGKSVQRKIHERKAIFKMKNTLTMHVFFHQ